MLLAWAWRSLEGRLRGMLSKKSEKIEWFIWTLKAHLHVEWWRAENLNSVKCHWNKAKRLWFLTMRSKNFSLTNDFWCRSKKKDVAKIHHFDSQFYIPDFLKSEYRSHSVGHKSIFIHLLNEFGQRFPLFGRFWNVSNFRHFVGWSKLSCKICCQIEQTTKEDKRTTAERESTRLEYFMATSSSAWNSLFTIV